MHAKLLTEHISIPGETEEKVKQRGTEGNSPSRLHGTYVWFPLKAKYIRNMTLWSKRRRKKCFSLFVLQPILIYWVAIIGTTRPGLYKYGPDVLAWSGRPSDQAFCLQSRLSQTSPDLHAQ